MNTRERKVVEGLLFGMNGRNCSPNQYGYFRNVLRGLLGKPARLCPVHRHSLDDNGWCYYCKDIRRDA